MPNGYGRHGYGQYQRQTDFSTGQEDDSMGMLQRLLNMSGKAGGLFGMGAGPTGMALSFGGELFKGLSRLIGGKSDAEKRSEKVFNLAQSRLGQPVIKPETYLPYAQRAMAPRMQKLAQIINKRGMLDTGVGQGELASAQITGLSEFLLNLRQQADILKSQKENFLLSIMGSTGR